MYTPILGSDFFEQGVPHNRGMSNPLHALTAQGQSVWLDDLRREMFAGGELADLIGQGIRGLTTNPTIFEHAIAKSDAYDGSIAAFADSDVADAQILEALMIEDVRRAADLFRPVYDATQGRDGYVSIEVSPMVAHDTQGALREARRLWTAVDRPNAMIKIPGTPAGWPAIERLLFEGININVTLLFSLAHYREVAAAHLRALEARVTAGRPINTLASVASLFVSRVDSAIDAQLPDAPHAAALKGKAGIANAQRAYAAYVHHIAQPRWRNLHLHGALPQRLLWASTAPKGAGYPPLMYVESLIARDTVNTLPPKTLNEVLAHVRIGQTLSADTRHAEALLSALRDIGIELDAVLHALQEEGIEKFRASYAAAIAAVGNKRDRLRQRAAGRG